MTKTSYKELKTQLDSLLERMQEPDVEIDEALELHAKAADLIDRLEKYLTEVEQDIHNATQTG